MQLSLIEHKTETGMIHQRLGDGYVNATELCKACGKQFRDYMRSANTKPFLYELEPVVRESHIGDLVLVKTIKGGIPQYQGTWVHPQVAIHLAQWLSPKFSVAVTQWVFDWMNGNIQNKSNLPKHVRRYVANHSKIPHTHFSMLNELIFSLVAPLEAQGYELPDTLMPDISMGKMFSQWIRNTQSLEPKDFPSYSHEFSDGRRAVKARLYPNHLLSEFKDYFHSTWLIERSMKYLTKKDPEIAKYLPKLIETTKKNLNQ